MAYERPDESTTYIGSLLRRDDSDGEKRSLANIIFEALGYSDTNIATKTEAEIATDLDSLLSR